MPARRMTEVARTAARPMGLALAAATRAVSVLRPAPKPLHPRGSLHEARIHRHGSDPRTGVPWLDEPGEDEVVVRLSRAIGLPAGWPDIHGLALRLVADGVPGDLLFASTGRGRAGRFLLTLGRRPEDRPMTTLLPYRTEPGPVLLGAFATAPGTYELCWARGAGPWHHFGALELAERARPGEISFDPVRHRVGGLEPYPALTLLREPAYRSARRSRA